MSTGMDLDKPDFRPQACKHGDRCMDVGINPFVSPRDAEWAVPG